MRIRYVIVFQKEELNLDSVLTDLKKYGTPVETQDDELVGENRIPVTLVYMDSNIIQFALIKRAYHLAPMQDNEYILFPMLNEEERQKVLENL